MSRAIDDDALKLDIVEEGQKSKRYKIGEFWELNRDEIWNVIDRQPTIEPERKKGQWIKKMRITETEKETSYDPEWYCACCGTKYDPHIARMVNFCYVCGSDMRGEQE